MEHLRPAGIGAEPGLMLALGDALCRTLTSALTGRPFVGCLHKATAPCQSSTSRINLFIFFLALILLKILSLSRSSSPFFPTQAQRRSSVSDLLPKYSTRMPFQNQSISYQKRRKKASADRQEHTKMLKNKGTPPAWLLIATFPVHHRKTTQRIGACL